MIVSPNSADALLDAYKDSGLDWDEWLAEQRIVRDESEIPDGEEARS